MVKKTILKKFLDKHLSEMQHTLDGVSIEMNEDKLHYLRLQAKKVKAVSGFLKESLHEKDKYAIKEIKELYAIAGNIRTAQLTIKTLESHEIKSETFEKDQKEIIENDSKVIACKNRKFAKNISGLRRKMSKNLTSIQDNSVIAFYYSNIKILSNNFKIIDEENLHDSRKIIKKLLYNLKLLPPVLLEKIRLNKDYLDNLQDLIGKWHDTEFTINLLTKDGTVDEQGINSLVKQKQDQLQTIIDETREFDNNVMLAKHKK